MNAFLRCFTLFLFAIGFLATSVSAQGIDELMAICSDKSEAYLDLADQISDLSEILTISSNELDLKGDELNQLALDLQKVMEQADNLNEELANQMDSFEAGCLGMMREKCIGMEKDFEKFAWKIEPVIEMGDEPIYRLEEIDNRYDEKLILKQFEKAEKAAVEVAEALIELEQGIMELAEACN